MNFIKLYRKCFPGIPTTMSKTSVREYKNWYAPYLKEMKSRQERAETIVKPRSAFVNWNYPAELFAFTNRLNEQISDATLRTTFIHQSYIEQEEQQRKQLGAEDVILNLTDNQDLIKLGSAIMETYIKKYIRFSYPHVPDEAVLAVYEYLVSEELLAYVGKNIGITDLILAKDNPPETKTLASTFKALIGAIVTDNDVEKGEHFVLDFVLTQLIGKDIHQIWEIQNPIGMLNKILHKQGLSEPEPRLLRETGRNTLFAVYIVGLYVDKKLIGQGPGESLNVAEEMAALDALRKIFKTTENHSPLKFGIEGKNLNLNALN